MLFVAESCHQQDSHMVVEASYRVPVLSVDIQEKVHDVEVSCLEPIQVAVEPTLEDPLLHLL